MLENEENFTEVTEESSTDTQLNENNKKKGNKFWPGFFLGMLICLMVASAAAMITYNKLTEAGYTITNFKLDQDAAAGLLSEKVENKIAEVISAMTAYYYEDIDQSEAAEGLYAGLVDSLGDPYSQYFTAEDYQDYISSVTGTYYGIGAVLTQDATTKEVSVTRVYAGSPAEKAGVMVGDIILSANGTPVGDMELSEFVTYIRGDEGTKVDLVINRDGEEFTITAVRAKLSIPTVESEMLEDNIGYIQITEFDSVTTSQFKDALKVLKKQGMEKLIVDLRDNPGGLVSTVTDILDEILPEGLLVYTEDKAGNREEYNSDSTELGMPLVVLVNENSASASEIFAGAIKDYGYGTILGKKTFGKGIVQVMIPLSDGSAVKVTTARYYTPNGNFIHGVGIEPDVELDYEFLGEEGEKYDKSLDNQLLKAIELLK